MARRTQNAVVLTAGERTTLEGWTRSRTSSQARAMRARIVLACEKEATNTAVATKLGVSVDMVRMWRSRFVAERLTGLAERPRPGRPRTITDDTITRVLVHTLAPPPNGRRWSTRAMAEAVGLSQTRVSRIWRTHRVQSKPDTSLRYEVADQTLLQVQIRDVVGLFLAPPLRVLAVAAEGANVMLNEHPATSRPSTSRKATQAGELFAVANAFAEVRGTSKDQHDARNATSLHTFLEHLNRSVPARMAVHVLAEDLGPAVADTVESWTAGHPRFHQHIHGPHGSWIDTIDVLLAHNPLPSDDLLGPAASLAALRDDLHSWCAAWRPRSRAFSWVKTPRALWSGDAEFRGLIIDSKSADRTTVKEPGTDENASHGHGFSGPPRSPRMADRVAKLVREALATGQFKPGERVKEAPLAARLGISRGPVREALRVLAEEGMLELLPNRGAAVPNVAAQNILDTYAMRAYLGSLLMRRVATLPRSALRPISTALAEVRVVAGHGDHARIGDADLVFQDEIARTAQLPHAGRVFANLTMRIRMFNAVLQLDWAEAVDLIARENFGIYEAIRDGDGNEAARRWRVKVERSVRYMVAQLPQDHFDPELWVTIAGQPRPRRSTRRTV